MRRYLLLGCLGFLAAGTGCAHRPCCVGSVFPGRPHLLRPAIAAPVAPAGVPLYDGGAGYGAPAAPGCASCGGGAGMPIASTGGYPQGFQAGLSGAPSYGPGGIPHDSVLLSNPTVLPPGTGTPRIDVDPPKPMPMTGGK